MIKEIVVCYLSSFESFKSLGGGLLVVDAFEITVAGLAVVKITSFLLSGSSLFLLSPEFDLHESDETEFETFEQLPGELQNDFPTFVVAPFS